jgi:hypothetical protein
MNFPAGGEARRKAAMNKFSIHKHLPPVGPASPKLERGERASILRSGKIGRSNLGNSMEIGKLKIMKTPLGEGRFHTRESWIA